MQEEKRGRTSNVQLPKSSRPIRMGIVGGSGGFIGPVHAIAARMDNRYQLVAGALSSNPETAKRAGAEWFLSPERSYTSYQDMARQEAARPDGIEVVAITTPNFTHHEIARTFLEAGIHVVCDKPITTTLQDARDLVQRAADSDLLFAVPHAFAAYPMVRQAQAMIANGELGDIRLVHVEFVMDWLTRPIDQTGDGQAAWRTDPKRSGPGGAIADIGTHAWHLAQFVSGQRVTELLADIDSLVPGRRLDDNAHVLLRFENGARGTMIITQVAPGNDCGLRIRVYGTEGGIEWRQDDVDVLRYTPTDQAPRLLSKGNSGLLPESYMMTRVPKGHPEGYLEGFANVYSEVAVAIEAKREGRPVDVPLFFATAVEGLAGVAFVEAALASQAGGNVWVDPGRYIRGDIQ
ncbi:Gfo/Idh/MocA family oxidoreductase (plasmid) [Rhizobium grahamii]|uniref:Gfo/Idh/MocA family oxidoreductase n=1 Tax=Rhizobium grahamii TaxID=1120045 RepID=A0A5Q0CCC8_9HYPH|nr:MULTISPECIES: Gfo/Idh/MocA family oxidoreductase [Rhizobium]QFY63518.1 Gfo/Idh/MocA family oxidoreductase [Rhizobium grahamii]QRM53012.1 Gfo/Idh/MocA family oxidoreductase [Rhizobium sp. BG6]